MNFGLTSYLETILESFIKIKIFHISMPSSHMTQKPIFSKIADISKTELDRAILSKFWVHKGSGKCAGEFVKI